MTARTDLPDILVFMSDQHDGRCMSFMGDPVIRTPALDRLAESGTAFCNAYSPCPLCVPARMSFLSMQLPHKTGVFTNHGSLHPETPTFLHSLTIAGYETVLCGRMHFEGKDQRHGFTRRIAGDITPTDFGGEAAFLERFAPCSPLLTDAGCLKAVGRGTSPTLEYDRYVVSKALEYLEQPHEWPQFLLVGTYGPHYPYVSPADLYDDYRSKVRLPGNLHAPRLSWTLDKPYDTDEDLVLAVRAAYAGMITFEDQCVGMVHEAFRTWKVKHHRKGVFIYLSDHGEQAGERGLYGKQTLFEPSVRIPMIFEGDGVPRNKRVNVPVSLLDVGPSLCQLTGAPLPPDIDGMPLSERCRTKTPVISEWIDAPYRMGTHYGRMIREDKWKLVSFPDFPEEDLLTIPDEDYYEMNNLISQMPDLAGKMREEAFRGICPEEIVRKKNLRTRQQQLLEQFSSCSDGVFQTASDDEMTEEEWKGSGLSRELPDITASSAKPLPEKFRPYWIS